jgi:hypothetical protein
LCLGLYPKSKKIVADKLEDDRWLRACSLDRKGYQRRFLLVPVRSSAFEDLHFDDLRHDGVRSFPTIIDRKLDAIRGS